MRPIQTLVVHLPQQAAQRLELLLGSRAMADGDTFAWIRFGGESPYIYLLIQQAVAGIEPGLFEIDYMQ